MNEPCPETCKECGHTKFRAIWEGRESKRYVSTIKAAFHRIFGWRCNRCNTLHKEVKE